MLQTPESLDNPLTANIYIPSPHTSLLELPPQTHPQMP